MNIKQLIIPLGLALVTTWAMQTFIINRWFGPKQRVDETSFVAPTQQQVTERPLLTTIDFTEVKRSTKPTITPIETEWGSIEFSTDGAAIDHLAFKRTINRSQKQIDAIFTPSHDQRIAKAFIVGLAEKTPYVYELVKQTDSPEFISLTYHAKTATVEITKLFTVYKNIHKIDLELTCTSLEKERKIEPRIMFPSPFMPSLEGGDTISTTIVNRLGKFEKINKNALNLGQGWYQPTIFGAEDRYFIQALVSDEQHFVQRAYFNDLDKTMISVLEGPASNQETTWKLSFYVGPKEVSAIKAVDARLEQALDYYGMLAPISKLLLAILNWLYQFVGNYGLAIIILTLLMKLLLLPFTLHSERSLKQSADAQKKLTYIQQKFKDDPEALRREREEFIRKNGLGLSGCLPMLAQIPIFFALSRVLNLSIELYQAPFLWISDLSSADPYYILPVLITGSMLLQMMVNPQADAQKRFSVIAMAMVFGAVATSFSAGLALYIAVSTLIGVLQTMIVNLFKHTR